MLISDKTKISELIRKNPDSIEAIATISKHFEKLKNPLLRKLLASRVTIADAAKIGNCMPDDFFKVLAPLGFQKEKGKPSKQDNTKNAPIETKPEFLQNTDAENIVPLDVREIIGNGNDPLNIIINKLKDLPSGKILLLINSFEPIPLINLLRKQGYSSFTEKQNHNLVYTYFIKNPDSARDSFKPIIEISSQQVFDEVLNLFSGKIIFIDVCNLEMPLPMITILQELERLPSDFALFVNHKRIPQYLLPEIEERGYTLLIKEINKADFKLLIYK